MKVVWGIEPFTLAREVHPLGRNRERRSGLRLSTDAARTPGLRELAAPGC